MSHTVVSDHTTLDNPGTGWSLRYTTLIAYEWELPTPVSIMDSLGSESSVPCVDTDILSLSSEITSI